jgi:hypothetical protein
MSQPPSSFTPDLLPTLLPPRNRFAEWLSFLRFIYLALLPIAGCVMIQTSGFVIGQGWGFGIAIGLFIYHYLLWALFETERHNAKLPRKLWLQLGSLAIVLVSVQGNWRDWLVEQTILEAGAFTLAVAILAVRKASAEGKQAPWYLVVLVFLLPTGAIIFHLSSFWWTRHRDSPDWWDLAFAIAAVLSTSAHLGRLQPYILGHDSLMEPLSSQLRLIFMVVWLVLLLVGGMAIR